MSGRRHSGFTVIELMITIMVGAILLTVAVPSFRTLILNNRITTQANLFVTDLILARSEAIKTANSVFVSGNSPSAGNQFGGGWTVWVDRDDDGVMGGTEAIRISEALAGGNTLESLQSASQVQYLPNGTLAAGATRSFRLCDSRGGDTGRLITISAVGRPRVTNANCP